MSIVKLRGAKEEVITARCDSRVKEILHLLSRSERLSMSQVIAKSILEYHKRRFPDQSFSEEEQELFGRYGSSKGDLSINRKQYLRKMLSGKHSRN